MEEEEEGRLCEVEDEEEEVEILPLHKCVTNYVPDQKKVCFSHQYI